MRLFGKLAGLVVLVSVAASHAHAQTNTVISDPVLDLLIQKGIISQAEAKKLRADVAANQATNSSMPKTKWAIGVKNGEFFGDVRLRYENREAWSPNGSRLEFDRLRFAARVGLRADLPSDFYFGLRLETSSNPRSSWVDLATSSSGVPFNGPWGKSSTGVNVGQIYIGYRPKPWADITLGKMPNPIYTTPMVWDQDINPEGGSERFNFKVGQAELFGTFGQFFYEDVNPTRSTPGLIPTLPSGSDASAPWMFVWQLGGNYHINDDVAAKAAATLYNYTGTGGKVVLNSSGAVLNPVFTGPFVGEGSPAVNGSSGFPSGPNNGFTFNQTGINDLLVLEFPFELNFKISDYRARFFGEFAMNLDGADRARAAVFGAAHNPGVQLTLPLQKNDVKAYQVGFAFANGNNINTINGANNHRRGWETRVYWQHVEQYALDVNLMDSDFFEGRGNLEGIYAAAAYSVTDNIIGTVRFGHAWRINPALGTGGANQDLPFANPIQDYQIIQADVSCRF